jgi:multiple sugar transport system permease protein
MTRAQRRIGSLLSHGFLIAASLVMIAPFLWMVFTALKGESEIYAYPPSWLPSSLHWENFAHVWQAVPFGRFYINSIVVTAIITVSQVFTAALAGYAFARLQFPGRDTIFYLYLATLMVPGQVTMLPLFLIMNRLGWIDTYQGLTAPFLMSVFATFFLRQFFTTIPKELEDAARIDGCGRLRFLWQIMLPLSRPALGAVTLFTFLSHWDDYLWPLVITNSTQMRTLPIGLRFFVEESGAQYHYMMAAALIALAPVLALFFVAQRQFIEGIALTGLKG